MSVLDEHGLVPLTSAAQARAEAKDAAAKLLTAWKGRVHNAILAAVAEGKTFIEMDGSITMEQQRWLEAAGYRVQDNIRAFEVRW